MEHTDPRIFDNHLYQLLMPLKSVSALIFFPCNCTHSVFTVVAAISMTVSTAVLWLDRIWTGANAASFRCAQTFGHTVVGVSTRVSVTRGAFRLHQTRVLGSQASEFLFRGVFPLLRRQQLMQLIIFTIHFAYSN